MHAIVPHRRSSLWRSCTIDQRKGSLKITESLKVRKITKIGLLKIHCLAHQPAGSQPLFCSNSKAPGHQGSLRCFFCGSADDGGVVSEPFLKAMS